MAYIGNQPADIGVYAVQAATGNGSTTVYTLDRAATTASISISIDGVDQIPTTAYAVTVGTTLTFTSAPPSSSAISIRFLGDTVSFGEPSDDSVATVHIQDDAVTAAKLANSINTEITANTAKTGITSGQASAITANTAKVTNATHTGDVTGATALTIATDAVDIAMLSATGTADATTFLRGDNAWAAATTAARYVYAWRETSNQSVSSGVDTLVELNGVTQSHSAYSTGTYTWTATADDAGIWVFIAQCSVHYDDSNGDESKTYIYLNGVKSSGAIAWVWTGGTDYLRHYTFTQQYLVSISEADTIKMYASLNAPSGTINLFAGSVAAGPKNNSLLGFKL